MGKPLTPTDLTPDERDATLEAARLALLVMLDNNQE